jgi:lysophospholipase L1-like esterase
MGREKRSKFANDAKSTAELASSLAQKLSQGNVAVSDINKNFGKFDQTYMSDELLQQIAGTTPVNAVPADGIVTTVKMADKAVTIDKTNFINKSKNMFNKKNAIQGFYVETGSGVLQPNATYYASDWIPCLPETVYTTSHFNQISFYGADKVYLYLNPTTATFTTPANCYFIRASVPGDFLEIYQLEKGSTTTTYEEYFLTIESLKVTDEGISNSISELENSARDLKSNKVGYFRNVFRHLNNPFVRTKIVELGDSITAGLTGTGYSTTGEPVGATGVNANVSTAICWANMLNKNILETFNKEVYVEIGHPEIVNTITEGTYEKNGGTYLKWRFMSENTKDYQKISFTFYGDHFSIVYGKTLGSGILEVWVDGVKLADLDTYGEPQYSAVANYTSLSIGQHAVEIRQTNRKNVSSSANVVYLEAVKIPKTVQVRNWGVSGVTSEWIYDYLWTLLQTDDDILILQIGTNDRSIEKTPSATRSFIREIVKYAQNKGIEVILMSANPTSIMQINDPLYNYDMNAVDTAINQVATEFNMPYISNYQYFIEYADTKGISVDTLLPDGLHPNDIGYKVMYNNVARNIGLSIIRDGA